MPPPDNAVDLVALGQLLRGDVVLKDLLVDPRRIIQLRSAAAAAAVPQYEPGLLNCMAGCGVGKVRIGRVPVEVVPADDEVGLPQRFRIDLAVIPSDNDGLKVIFPLVFIYQLNGSICSFLPDPMRI